ncbi:hypothetical protein DPEC_G00214760 [Dallia pectoralis]|uniref:Uncharacterized protein n=1 Tax=Dallia pectoralis TaxID=75939 RepID=A0ACC2G259_DALPE|nr:hypothetical protein DPEC_G00214760 [Dallia pectoralis]
MDQLNRTMEKEYTYFSLRTTVSFLLVLLLQRSTEAQICSISQPAITIEENNSVGETVTTITTQEAVTLNLTRNPGNAFHLNGNNLTAAIVLDYEETRDFSLTIECKKGDQVLSLTILIMVENVNDNPPVFAQSEYILNVDELSPIDKSVGEFVATDKDESPLFYRLEPDTTGFKLQGDSPIILVQQVLYYETVKTMTLKLYAQDTRTSTPPSFTATATIQVNILDVNNRPPWFQPCNQIVQGMSTICLNSGYTVSVNLTEQEVGPLQLKPGPLFAIDGDTSLNAPITYTIVAGNDAGIFQINGNTGNITMSKVMDTTRPPPLTVLARETTNGDQFAMTTVQIDVVSKSKNLPLFEKTNYEGFVSADAGIDSMVLDGESSSRPLRVQATDADFADGINPFINYEAQEGKGFSITSQGFILMSRSLEPGPVSLQLRAVDSASGESCVTTLNVEVMPGITTVAPTTEMNTTEMATTEMATTEMTTTEMTTTEMTTAERATTEMASTDTATTKMATTDVATAIPTTSTTADMILLAQGGYGPGDMASLGVSLAVLLIIAMVIIGLLFFRIRKSKTAWRKLSEASIFRSSLGKGPGELKDGVQYTNEGFQSDGDNGSVNSKSPDEMDGMKPGTGNQVTSRSEMIQASAALYTTLKSDTSSQSESDKADSEKEVKPILTKERRVEEGYKSVWFKEDIDPNAKEEVVIIPDNEEPEGDDDSDDDSEVDDDDDDKEEDQSKEEESKNVSPQTPKAMPGGMDNKRRARFEDSEDEEEMQTDDL